MTARYDPDFHHRRSIRLRDYDYTHAGAYFVTIVAHNRACPFGDVDGTGVRLNDAGHMVAATWNSLSTRFVDIDLDAFVVMPNHIHGIIVIARVIDPAIDPGGQPQGLPLRQHHWAQWSARTNR